MKCSICIPIILIFSVFTVAGHPPRAAEKTRYLHISYSAKPIHAGQVSSNEAGPWQEVLKNYPAAAMVLMCQEAAQSSLAYQQIQSTAEALPAYVNSSGTPLASAIEDTARLKSCIEKFIRCDLHAASDGVVSVDEIQGCSNAFSNCWTRQKK